MDNRVTGALSADQVASIKSKVSEIRALLPFAIDLSQDELMSMIKLGGKSLEFAQTANEAVKELPDLLPRSIDADELQRDLDLFASLESIRLTVEPLLRVIVSTQTAVGTDAMEVALEVYASLKRQSKDSRAKTYLEPMQARFARSTQTSSNTQ